MNVTVLALMKAKPGKENDTRDALLGLIGPTLDEAGCINYDLHELAEAPGSFMFYENWKSKEDLDAHLKKPHLESFLGRAGDLLEGDPEIRIYTKIG